MNKHKKQLQLVAIMEVITLIATTVILIYLYNIELEQRRQNLQKMVIIDAQLIESVAQYDKAMHIRLNLDGKASSATISQVHQGFLKSDKFKNAEQRYLITEHEDSIQISTKSYQDTGGKNIFEKKEPIASLFHIAIKEKQGTTIGYDIYGNKVLAAFAYIPTLDHVILSKINLDEFQYPFYYAAIYSFLIATLLIFLSSYIFIIYIGNITKKLADNQDLLDHLLESSSESIYRTDEQGNCTFANPACIKTLGYSSTIDLVGKNMHQLVHHSYENGEPYNMYDSPIYRAFKDGGNQHINHEVFWKSDGTPLLVDYNAYPIYKHEKIIGTVVSFNNKREQESALDESEKRYKSLFEDAFVGIAYVSLEGKVITINQQLCEITGYNREELHKLTFMQLIHPDDLSSFMAKVNSLLSGESNRHIMEKRYIHKLGHIVWVELMISLLQDIDGKPKNFVSVVNDISARKESEQTLKKAQEAYSQAEQITHFGNWDWDITNSDLSWTDEIYRIFGIAPQLFSATYDAFLNTIHPDDRQAVIDAVNMSVTNETIPYNIEHRIVRPNGENRYVQEQGKVYRNDKGEPIRMIGTVHDITERKLAEIELNLYKDELENLVNERTQELISAQDELVKKERLATLGQLTATVSHELRNPLAAIRPSLYIVEKLNSSPDKKLLSALQRITRNVERCDHIIDELLDFTRITSLDLQPTNFDNWLEVTTKDEISTISNDINLELQLNSNNRLVDIDKGRLQRVFINLIENACQAMRGQQGKVHKLNISSQIDDQYITIVISDNGPGIDDEVMPHIFEPLFSTKGFGVGLGMSLVKQIIEQHHGNINVISDFGIETRVTITLPIHQPSIQVA